MSLGRYRDLCNQADVRGLAVELVAGPPRGDRADASHGRHLVAVRVIRPGTGGGTAVKLVEASITYKGIDDAAGYCLAILTRQRAS